MRSWHISEEIDFHCVLSWLTVSGRYLFIKLYCFFRTSPLSSIHFAADIGLLVGMHLTNRDSLQINSALQCLHRRIFAGFRYCEGYSFLKRCMCASLPSKKDEKKKKKERLKCASPPTPSRYCYMNALYLQHGRNMDWEKKKNYSPTVVIAFLY